ncbi:MAG: PD-(D/E)XK nuclease family protein [Firmicutes bacterium]|nr:PD-(D/E)XK nuclease family protein [Bacillota bacterium]
MGANLENMYFSQAALNAWFNCPLKFRRRYVDGLYWPQVAESDPLERGRKFHLLAQSYYATGSTYVPPGDRERFRPLVEALTQFLPRTEDRKFLPEYELRMNDDGLKLLAKYDLLVVDEQTVTIYDWKTDSKPLRPAIADSPQTRLYLFLLCSLPRYFNLVPEAASMVYWNPIFPEQTLEVKYNQSKFVADRQWLQDTIGQIRKTQSFVAAEQKCRWCEYRPLCHGESLETTEAEEEQFEEIDWDEISEIAWQGVNIP